MEIKKYSILLVSLLILVLTNNVSAKVEGHLWLEPVDGGSYNGESDDAWLDESYLITESEFDLSISNNDPNDGDVYHLYLIVAVNMDPVANGITVTINNEASDVYSWKLVEDNNNEPKVCGFKYPPHGIYLENNNVYYLIREVAIRDNLDDGGSGNNNGTLEYGEVTIVHVVITSNNQNARVHFDSVGCDQDCKAKEFVPPSHDTTYQVPEFPTIAIPAILIIGLLFILRNRN